MNKNRKIVEQFSKNLFWDINTADIDMERNKRFIMQRVLEYGTLDDWKLIKNYYGIATIGLEMKQIRNLDDLALSFISLATGIDKEEFRCYTTKQSLPQPWNF